MQADCHMHMVLDGVDWKQSLAAHESAPQTALVHKVLKTYQALGVTYLRDGGDRFGAGALAREIAPQYGITYRTPLAPLCLRGHYGSFIGICYDTLSDYARLVVQTREQGGDFIKIMVSGLMDFDRFGVLTQEPLPPALIKELIHIAHEEGMSVMAHANGARTVEAAANAGVDSVEHGAYLDADALSAMESSGTVWVPTLSTIGNLRGRGRFCEDAVCRILDSALQNVERYRGLIAPGTDAGAWAVPHGSATEVPLLATAGITPQRLEQGIHAIKEKF